MAGGIAGGYIDASNAMADQQALALLGRAMQGQGAGPAMPGSPLWSAIAGGIGGQGGGGMPGGAPAGPPSPGPFGQLVQGLQQPMQPPQMAMPGQVPMPRNMGAPGPSAPMPPGPALPGGGGPPMAGGPPMQSQGRPPPGGMLQPPGGAPGARPSMSWQDVARQIVQANPGAPPEAVARAVTMAMPLMNADSQQQWRQVQMQLQQERINQGQERLTQQQSQFDTREAGRAEGRQERQREFDTREGRLREQFESTKDNRARTLELAAQREKDKVLMFSEKQDAGQRQQALASWDRAQRAYDAYMRSKVNAAANLPEADKKKFFKDLDAEWGNYQREREELQKQVQSGRQPGFTPGGSPEAPASARPAAPAEPPASFNSRFGASGAVKPLNDNQRSTVQQYLQANPGKRDEVFREMQQGGYSTEGL